MMEFFGNGRGVAALVGLLLVAVAPASAQPLTTARDDFASSLGARGITFADFNRDGWVDIATSNEGPSRSVPAAECQAGAGATRRGVRKGRSAR